MMAMDGEDMAVGRSWQRRCRKKKGKVHTLICMKMTDTEKRTLIDLDAKIPH